MNYFLSYPVEKIFVAISKLLLFVLLCDCNAVVNWSKFHEKNGETVLIKCYLCIPANSHALGVSLTPAG